MENINSYYTTPEALKFFLVKNDIRDNNALLIQVFSASNDKSFIEKLLKNLTTQLPQAIIIGSTTDGEIMNGKVSTDRCVLSFTQFEHTTLKAKCIPHHHDSYETGQSLAKALVEDETKLLIAFADGLHTNGSAFLSGIQNIDKQIKVAGGMAGDSASFVKTYVFDKSRILSNGVVAVALQSKNLTVKSTYSFNWRALGKELTVTKVEGNRVFTIDNRSALDTYAHYLGEPVAKSLPKIGVEFPLIVQRHGVSVARAVMAKHEDGALTFAGDFKEGEKVRFGHGDASVILQHSQKFIESMYKIPSQVHFVYSCMARRRFMQNEIEIETLALQELASTSGFFTYGEFFTSHETCELLNQTMTVVSLDEKTANTCMLPKKTMHYDMQIDTAKNALIHLLDVVNQEAKEQEGLDRERKAFQLMFEKSPDGILIIKDHTFVQCNQKMIQMLKYDTKASLLSLRPGDFTPEFQPNGERSLEIIERMISRTLEEGEKSFELTYKKADGELFWADVVMISMWIDDKKVIKAVYRDISHRKEMEKMLSSQKDILYYQARHDVLTGLPNRTLFAERLAQGVEKDDDLALMFIDLDQFKAINDSLGHNVGDSVLRITASRLHDAMGEGEMVFRLGGDEFTIIIEHLKEPKRVSDLAQKILDVLKEPMIHNEHVLYVSGSIGISLYPKDATNEEDLLKHSDVAMYKAKELGRSCFVYYEKEMSAFAYARLTMKSDLYQAIKDESFEVYYQPQVDAKEHTIVGVEALIRWHNPRYGMISPVDFLPLAHETGIIVEMDWWVMKSAMEQVSYWYSRGIFSGTLALNFTLKQLEDDLFILKLQNYMKETGFKPHWLELEIPESDVMRNPESVIRKLKELKALNINIAIDDFGTGYSSLAYLKRLPIHKLKIDGSFMHDIPKDKDSTSIVEAIITLANSLSLDVIAEGVETKEQKDFLVAQGCHHIQGYFYSKAIAKEEMYKVLTEGL